VIIDRALHINGRPDVVLTAGGTYDSSTRLCTPACHGSETW
jgi:hypothetical protein